MSSVEDTLGQNCGHVAEVPANSRQLLVNWRGNNRSLPRELGTQDLQGETEGTGLDYPGDEETKGQPSSSLHLPRGEL